MRPTALSRTFDRKMFNHIYKERFGEGITSSKTGPKIMADHHFGNASLMQTTVARIEIPLPDVTMNQQTMEEIQKVGSEASVVFRKFSAFATENPEECQSLSGLGILPVALWPSDIREMYEAFRSDPPKVMKFQELPGYPPSGATLKRFRLNNFVEKLATMGLGMDPDSRLGVELPGPDDPVAVFAARDLEKSQRCLQALQWSRASSSTCIDRRVLERGLFRRGSFNDPQLSGFRNRSTRMGEAKAGS